jgi:hypothetical protein
MRNRVDQKVTDPDHPTESIDPPLAMGMAKIEGVTHVTLEKSSLSAGMRAVGTRNPDFLFGLIHQVANASSNGESPDELGIKFMLGFLQSLAPRDEIEAMLVSQMAATHIAAMKYAYRLSEAESIEERESAERAFNKLIRTFAGLVEVYDRRRAVSREVAVAPVSVSGGHQRTIEKVPPPPHRPRLRRVGSRQAPTEVIGGPSQYVGKSDDEQTSTEYRPNAFEYTLRRQNAVG